MTGSHWWQLPNNWGKLFSAPTATTAQYNRYLCENAPLELARCLGVPLIHANHCGTFKTISSCLPCTTKGLPFHSEFVGSAQIIDANGQVLASRPAQAGEGIVIADVDLTAKSPAHPLEEDFWIPALPALLKFSWHQDRLWSRVYYQHEGRQLGLDAAAKRNS